MMGFYGEGLQNDGISVFFFPSLIQGKGKVRIELWPCVWE